MAPGRRPTFFLSFHRRLGHKKRRAPHNPTQTSSARRQHEAKTRRRKNPSPRRTVVARSKLKLSRGIEDVVVVVDVPAVRLDDKREAGVAAAVAAPPAVASPTGPPPDAALVHARHPRRAAEPGAGQGAGAGGGGVGVRVGHHPALPRAARELAAAPVVAGPRAPVREAAGVADDTGPRQRRGLVAADPDQAAPVVRRGGVRGGEGRGGGGGWLRGGWEGRGGEVDLHGVRRDGVDGGALRQRRARPVRALPRRPRLRRQHTPLQRGKDPFLSPCLFFFLFFLPPSIDLILQFLGYIWSPLSSQICLLRTIV